MQSISKMFPTCQCAVFCLFPKSFIPHTIFCHFCFHFRCRVAALHIAITEGWGMVAGYLMDVHANIHTTNAVGRTPLHIAATVGRSDIGAHLLRVKAPPGAMDSLGWTPRQTAEFHCHTDFCELMIRVEMADKQYSMKDVPPGQWDSPLWHEVSSSFHQQQKQMEKETRRFDKKIHRMSSTGSGLTRQPSAEFFALREDARSVSSGGGDSAGSGGFDSLMAQKRRQAAAREGMSSFAMAAKRNVGFK